MQSILSDRLMSLKVHKDAKTLHNSLNDTDDNTHRQDNSAKSLRDRSVGFTDI